MPRSMCKHTIPIGKAPEASSEASALSTPTFGHYRSQDPSNTTLLRQSSEVYSDNDSKEDGQDTEMSDGITDSSLNRPGQVNANSNSVHLPQGSATLDPRENVQELYAKSRRPGFAPPLPPCEEEKVVKEFLVNTVYEHLPRLSKRGTSKNSINSLPVDIEYMEFELSDFEIYLPKGQKGESSSYAFELRGLEHLHARIAHSSYLFDGILSAGDTRCYVWGVPFQTCSIGNYSEENHEVDGLIWIQSNFNRQSNIWYRLKSPSPDYARFHQRFLWLADLAKHFVDYSQASGGAVSIRDFLSNFSQWMLQTHQGSINFKIGIRIARNIGFLHKESLGVNEDLISMPIWSELLEMDAIPRQKIEVEQTVVTPYVYECFKDLKFGHLLKAVEAADAMETQQRLYGEMFHLTGNKDLPVPELHRSPRKVNNSIVSLSNIDKFSVEHNNSFIERKRKISAIKCGDVLSVILDGKGSLWRNEASRYKEADDCWYVCVQKIHTSKANERSFDVIWLYRASDTHCAKMKYLFPSELFLSSNCTCFGEKIKEEEVLNVVNVIWHDQQPSLSRELFIRQTYLENERFGTLKDQHKTCKHLRSVQGAQHSSIEHRFPIGQTVLAPPQHKSKYGLEVYEVVEYIDSGSKQMAILRRLRRRHEVDGKGRRNELVYTEKTETIEVKKIERTCLVRFYSGSDVANKLIPPPYCRDGTGNAFYITSRLIEVDGVYKLKSFDGGFPRSLLQGFDPSQPLSRRKLRGLDLYCGGGNFGRGLEEGGALHNDWAVDINNVACHTYNANLKEPTETKIFNGSVNDFLSQALRGNPRKSPLVPLPGDVDFISAGSPCQGFSSANAKKNNQKGLKNQSLIASVCAYIDFYRPKYGMLENVVGMAQKGIGRDEDVLSQLVCAIVGMGYQLDVFLLDAWSFGSPQSRGRVFITFAAPGLEAPSRPEFSHSHPTKVRGRDLGKLANDESFGGRTYCPTPFRFVSAGEGTADLPTIEDGALNPIRYPEHIVACKISQKFKDQFALIPKSPRGMTLSKAWERGLVTPEQRQKHFGHILHNFRGELRETFRSTSKAYGRVTPNNVFPPVLVRQHQTDARQGYTVHWDEDRVISLLEAKRAQSFPDEEVLVGTLSECWKLLGNSVARTVALSLGLSLREAWLKSDIDPFFPTMEMKNIEIQEESLSTNALNDWMSNSNISTHKGSQGKVSVVVDRFIHSIAEDSSSSFTTTSSNTMLKKPVYVHKSRRSRHLSNITSLDTARSHSPASTADERGEHRDRNSRLLNLNKARRSVPSLKSVNSASSILNLAATNMHSAMNESDVSIDAVSNKTITKNTSKNSEKHPVVAVTSNIMSRLTNLANSDELSNAATLANSLPRQRYEVLDSTASSDGESEISDRTCNQFMIMLPKAMPEMTIPHPAALSKNTASDNTSGASLKRLFDTLRIPGAGESERSRKNPRVVLPSSRQSLATKQPDSSLARTKRQFS